MRRDILESPEVACHNLGAELFRERNAAPLEAAIRVIGAESDPEAVVTTHEDELDFATGFSSDDLDGGASREQRSRGAIENRRARGPRSAERFELADVCFDRCLISSGPAGEHEMIDRAD